jgi:hypothetical protein
MSLKTIKEENRTSQSQSLQFNLPCLNSRGCYFHYATTVEEHMGALEAEEH